MFIEGTKQCFPLMMYGFYSDNALYSGSFSFAVFIFTLSHFETWHCYYFESSLSVLIYIKVLLIKKHKILFCSLLNMKKQFSLMCLFSCWFRISQVRYCQKKLSEVEDWRKKVYRYKALYQRFITTYFIPTLCATCLICQCLKDIKKKKQKWCISKFKILLECPSALSVQVLKYLNALSAQIYSKYPNVT